MPDKFVAGDDCFGIWLIMVSDFIDKLGSKKEFVRIDIIVTKRINVIIEAMKVFNLTIDFLGITYFYWISGIKNMRILATHGEFLDNLGILCEQNGREMIELVAKSG